MISFQIENCDEFYLQPESEYWLLKTITESINGKYNDLEPYELPNEIHVGAILAAPYIDPDSTESEYCRAKVLFTVDNDAKNPTFMVKAKHPRCHAFDYLTSRYLSHFSDSICRFWQHVKMQVHGSTKVVGYFGSIHSKPTEMFPLRTCRYSTLNFEDTEWHLVCRSH